MNFIERKVGLFATLLCLAGAVVAPVSVWMIFNFAPVEKVMGMPQKIFYFHVPIAIFSYVGFFITFIGSIGYLWKKNLDYDRWALCGADVGVLFTSLMMVTGMIWGRASWGVWWTWDPRLTTALVLWLIFVGYLILRGQVSDPTQRARFSAVMGVVGYSAVPLVHYSVKLWSRGIHPPKPVLHPDMATTLMVGFVAIFFLFSVTLLLRVRYEFLKARIESAKYRSA